MADIEGNPDVSRRKAADGLERIPDGRCEVVAPRVVLDPSLDADRVIQLRESRKRTLNSSSCAGMGLVET